MENIFETNKKINAKIGADTEGATTFELVKAQVAKLGGDTSKVVDIRTGEQQVLEHIKQAGPGVVIQTSKDVTITENGTTVVSPDAGYDAIKDVGVNVNVPTPELEELSVTANGTYTPTKYGYSKVDVNVPSKPEQTKSVTINQNGTTSVLPDEGNVLSKVDVTVNVAGGGGAAVFHGVDPKFSLIEGEFPNAEFPDLISCYKMFSGCSKLTSVPLFDTSKVTTMYNMFYYCSSLTTVPQFNTSNVTNMDSMLYSCSALTEVPLFDTSNVTNMRYIFGECNKLTTVQQLDTSNVTNMEGMFYSCPSLTNFGGLLNIGQAYTSTFTYDLSDSSKLSDESIQNVINGLYDMTAKGFSPTLKFHSTVFAKLTDAQKQQITAKNWTVTA